MYGRPPPGAWQSNPNNANMAPLGPRGAGGIGAPPGPPPSFVPGPGSNGFVPQAGPSSLASPMASADASTTVFVGSITPGISDTMLQQLLNSCGQLVTLKRISPAFGFATFDHPEAVIRAIDFLNGLELPPPGILDASEAASKTKKLLVKADEKTKTFVDNYKANRSSRATAEDDLDASGRSAIAALVETLKRPDALSLFPDSSSANASAVPSHLKDLPPEDVPEEHRTSVLSEIDKFRQASAAREEEKRRRERVMERERMNSSRAGPSAASSADRFGSSSSSNVNDPQNYNHGAPNFVKPSTQAPAAAAPLDPEEADEMEERRRQEVKRKEDERRASEALAAYTHRERTRLAHWDRILDDAAAEKARREKAKGQLLRRTEEWDEQAERNHELFYVDRPRWRHFRGPMLRREMDEDEADAKREVEEQTKAEEEAKKFLERQEEEMKRHLEEQRQAGVLVADGATMQPLKLKMGASAAGATNVGNAAAGANQDSSDANANANAAAGPVAAAGFRMEDEEDDDGSGRGRRRIGGIKLNLSDGMTPEERQAAIVAKRVEVRSSLEGLDAVDLFARPIKWEWVDEALITAVVQPKVSASITEAVGEPVPELEDVVLEKIRAHDEPKSIEEVVEPVLAEEALAFTETVWRMLIEESTVAASGLIV